MKTKVFSKKLILNKKTVANLNIIEMAVLKGGVEITKTCVDCAETEVICLDLTVSCNGCGTTGKTCVLCDSNVSCEFEACFIGCM